MSEPLWRGGFRGVAALPLLGFVAGCGSPSAPYVKVAEGRSAPSAGAPPTIAYRLFSAPDLPDSRGAAQLVIEPDSVVLVPDEPWPLSTLRVVALDSTGRFLSAVPFTVEVDERTAERLDREALYTSSALLVRGPEQRGTLRIRVVAGGGEAVRLILWSTRPPSLQEEPPTR